MEDAFITFLRKLLIFSTRKFDFVPVYVLLRLYIFIWTFIIPGIILATISKRKKRINFPEHR